MTNIFVLSFKTMNELESFSVKLGQLKDVVDVINLYVWRDILEKNHCEDAEKLANLTETLLDLVSVREKEFDCTIGKISAYTVDEGD